MVKTARKDSMCLSVWMPGGEGAEHQCPTAIIVRFCGRVTLSVGVMQTIGSAEEGPDVVEDSFIDDILA